MLSYTKTTAEISFFYQDLMFLFAEISFNTVMNNIADIIHGKSAAELIELGDSLRRENSFGEAINAFNAAAIAKDATEEIRTRARVSIELIQEINGFVNVDLMNP
jgi:predicted ATP-grasp superfamily ATP-dependent carboligase